MKAVLLAAGRGTRLRPVTDSLPKCLVPVGGTPLLGIWLDAFRRAGITEVLVNTHHLPERVEAYLAGRAIAAGRDGAGRGGAGRGGLAARPGAGPAVRTSYEPELLGSAGTLLAHRDWLDGEEFFLAVNADNLTDFPLSSLIAAYRAGAPGGLLAAIAVFRSPDPRSGGVVEHDQAQIMTGFAEKPEHPAGDLVNAGIYAFSPRVLDELGGHGPGTADIGQDLLPRLCGRTRIVPVSGYFRDIGTVEAYRQAQDDWPPAHAALARSEP